jgi:hypothetical protein
LCGKSPANNSLARAVNNCAGLFSYERIIIFHGRGVALLHADVDFQVLTLAVEQTFPFE